MKRFTYVAVAVLMSLMVSVALAEFDPGVGGGGERSGLSQADWLQQLQEHQQYRHVADVHAAHRAYRSDELEWQAAPPSLPPGAEIVVLDGDPGGEGLFAIRVRWPANYQVPAHWHPTTEYLTILSGTFYFGMGDELDMTRGEVHTAGTFLAVPAESHHYAWTDEGVVFQLHAMAPFAFTYVNPEDDPRQHLGSRGLELEDESWLTRDLWQFPEAALAPALTEAE